MLTLNDAMSNPLNWNTTPPVPSTKKIRNREYWISQWWVKGKRRSKCFGRADQVGRRVAVARYHDFMGKPQSHQPRGIHIDKLCALFTQYADSYYVRADGSKTGESDNIFYALNPLAENFGGEPASMLGPRHIKLYQQMCIDNGLSRTTINQRVALIRRCVKWAQSEMLIPPTVLLAIQSVQPLKPGRLGVKESDPVTPVARATVDLTLKHLPETIKAMVELQWLTGMRPNEVCGMTPGEIDTSRARWCYEPRQHKTAHKGKRRRVYFGPKAKAILRPFLTRKLSDRMFTPVEAVEQRRGKRPAARVGTVYTTRSYRRAIWYACDAAKIERWNPNQLRHSAKNRIEAEHGLAAASVTLGHASLRTTEGYGNPDWKLAERVAM